MKPLNIDKTGCSNISSNCVVWQGPDISCIALCKGDSVTEVVYKMALELCTIMDTFDLSVYDLSCFGTGPCKPANFKDLIQLIIKKICYIQDCTDCKDSCYPCAEPGLVNNAVVNRSSLRTAGGSSDDTIVTIAPAFYYTNAFGDQVTTMTVTEYAVAIGNKVSGMVNTISSIQATLTNHSKRIYDLEQAPAPTIELPTVTPKCVIPGNAPTAMVTVLSSLEQQFCELRYATGMPNDIFTDIGKQPVSLQSSTALSNPQTIMSALPGFTSTVTNQAESLGNMWVTIQDIRSAVNNIIRNYIPNGCDGIDLRISAELTEKTTTIYITGVVPEEFRNTLANGTAFTIKDSLGSSFVTNINILDNLNTLAGVDIDLENSSLNLETNISIEANPSFTSITTGSQCVSCLDYTIENNATCVEVTYGVTAPAQIDYSYTTEAIDATYTIEIYDSLTNTLLGSNSTSNTVVQTVTGSFLPGFPTVAETTYKLRLVITRNDINTNCSFVLVTTI